MSLAGASTGSFKSKESLLRIRQCGLCVEERVERCGAVTSKGSAFAQVFGRRSPQRVIDRHPGGRKPAQYLRNTCAIAEDRLVRLAAVLQELPLTQLVDLTLQASGERITGAGDAPRGRNRGMSGAKASKHKRGSSSSGKEPPSSTMFGPASSRLRSGRSRRRRTVQFP
jgi:hypothetical protein